MQLSGWFCQGGTEFVEQSTLACALDRLTLLSAGSEPKVGALFAQAELNRSYCGQRDPILAATPKYHLLWKALANRQSASASGAERNHRVATKSHSVRLRTRQQRIFRLGAAITIDRPNKSVGSYSNKNI